MEKVNQDPMDPSLFVRITNVLERLESLSFNLNLWKAQNMYFSLREQLTAEMDEKVKRGDESAKEWFDAFNNLGTKLRIKIS